MTDAQIMWLVLSLHRVTSLRRATASPANIKVRLLRVNQRSINEYIFYWMCQGSQNTVKNMNWNRFFFFIENALTQTFRHNRQSYIILAFYTAVIFKIRQVQEQRPFKSPNLATFDKFFHDVNWFDRTILYGQPEKHRPISWLLRDKRCKVLCTDVG